jgi:hypothetical protein
MVPKIKRKRRKRTAWTPTSRKNYFSISLRFYVGLGSFYTPVETSNFIFLSLVLSFIECKTCTRHLWSALYARIPPASRGCLPSYDAQQPREIISSRINSAGTSVVVNNFVFPPLSYKLNLAPYGWFSDVGIGMHWIQGSNDDDPKVVTKTVSTYLRSMHS